MIIIIIIISIIIMEDVGSGHYLPQSKPMQ